MSSELLEIFSAIASGQPDAANEANARLIELQSSSPEEITFAAAEIISEESHTLDIYKRSLFVIKAAFTTNPFRGLKDIQKFWLSFSAEKRDFLKKAILRCLMIEDKITQEVAAQTLSVIIPAEPLEERKQIISVLNPIFTDEEQFGSGSKYGVLSAFQAIIEANHYRHIILANQNIETDAEIILEDTLSVLESDDASIELKTVALNTLITTSNGYEERKKTIFDDNDVAMRAFQCVSANFAVTDEKYHIRLYDLLYILLVQKYFDANEIFASLFETISPDVQSDNPEIVAAAYEFWTKFVEYEAKILANEETAEDSPQYIQQVYEAMFPCLLASLANDVESEEKRFDPTFTRPALKSRKLIEAFALINPEQIFQSCDEFLKANLGSESWNEVLGGLFALQANLHILSRTSKDSEYAYEALEAIKPLIEHDHYAVREMVIINFACIAESFEPNAEVLSALLGESLAWLQNTPIDAAATCVLIRKIVPRIEISPENFGVIRDNLFQVIERDDAFEYSSLLDKVSDAFFLIIRSMKEKTENIPEMIAIINGAIERIGQTTTTEMEEMRRNRVQIVLFNIAEEVINNITQSRPFFIEAITAGIEAMFEIAKSENCIPEIYSVIGSFIYAIHHIQDEEAIVKKESYYDALIAIISEMLQDESDENQCVGANVLSSFFFSCEGKAVESAPQMLELLMPLVQTAEKKMDYTLVMAKAAATVILANPEAFQEPAAMLFDIAKNIRKAITEEEDFPEVIKSVCVIYKAFVKAFEVVPNEINSRRIELLSPVKIASELPNKPLFLYSAIYNYIHCLAYSKCAISFNVILRKDFVKYFFTKSTVDQLHNMGGQTGLVTSLKNRLSRI